MGGTFGFGDGFFFVPRGSLSGLTVDYDASTYSMTFAQDTLANIGADSFNNTLAWTSQAGGNNTISYTTVGFVVPEPSSSLLVGLGALGLMVRRRR